MPAAVGSGGLVPCGFRRLDGWTQSANSALLSSVCRTGPSSTLPAVIEIGQPTSLDPGAEDPLDLPHHALISPGDEGEGLTRVVGTAGAANPVRVGVDGVRHVEVDDVGNVRHVDAAAAMSVATRMSNVPFRKPFDGALALVLRHVSLQAETRNEHLLQVRRQAAGPGFVG